MKDDYILVSSRHQFESSVDNSQMISYTLFITRGLVRSPHWGQLGESHRGLEEKVLLGTL